MDEEQTYRTNVAAALARIEKQTTLTNGRVTEQEKWRERATGIFFVIGFLFLPVASWVILNIISLKTTQLSEEALKAAVGEAIKGAVIIPVPDEGI